MGRALLALLHGALLVVALCVLVVPELRMGSLRYALAALAGASAVSSIWRLHSAGMLSLAPGAAMRHGTRSRFTALEGAASLAGAVALVVVSA